MSSSLKLKAGDIVVRYGRVLKTFKVNQEMVFLKPYFSSETVNNGNLTYSLPVKNIGLARIRKVVSKEELSFLFKSILQKIIDGVEVKVLDMKESVVSNNLTEIMKVVKMLWMEREAGLGLLSGGKLTVYKQALDQATEEVAAVRKLSLEKAKDKIVTALKMGRAISD